jgi:hypothetical protein
MRRFLAGWRLNNAYPLVAQPVRIYEGDMNIRPPILALSAALLLSACAAAVDGEVPSLAKRPYELSPEQVEALANAPIDGAGDDGLHDGPAPALPAATAQAMQAALADHRAGYSAFIRDLPPARAAVVSARGAAVGSENWVVAQMALTRLDSARAPSVAALGALDALYAQTVSALGVQNARMLADARWQVANDVDKQNRAVAELGAQLRY